MRTEILVGLVVAFLLSVALSACADDVTGGADATSMGGADQSAAPDVAALEVVGIGDAVGPEDGGADVPGAADVTGDPGGSGPDAHPDGRPEGQPDGGGEDATLQDSAKVDAALVDVPTPGDEGAAGDTAIGPDVPTIEPIPCGEVTFSYTHATATEVFVAGSFNDWSPTLAMTDPDGDATWTATAQLAPGSTYQYKFVVDGEWTADPNNPNTAPDGHGSVNSVITVAECGALVLVSHETGDGTFDATLASPDGGALDSGDIAVTVDWLPAPAAAISYPAGGSELHIALTELATGIHDVRVVTSKQHLLLKVYIGVSTDWRDAPIYFAMTDRFSNGDASNDAPLADVDWRTNYQGGDFAGITDRIEGGYFDALGVGAIWISWPADNPDYFHEGGYPDQDGCGLDPKTSNHSGTRYSAYHGYWPSKVDEVESRFGTWTDLRELVTTAHAHGIRVLLDFTANHVHDSSPLYAAHGDYFNQPAEVCQDVGWDTKPKTCWFTPYLPDLDYRKAAVRKELGDLAIWWVKATGADGFRLDAVKHIEMSFVEELRARLKTEIELTGVDFYLVGETFTGDPGLIQSFVGPNKLHGQFDFPSNLQILKAFAKREIGLDAMDQSVRSVKAVYNGGELMSTFLGNHDIARFISMASGGISCGAWDVVSNIAQGWRNPPGQPGDYAAYERLQVAFTYVMTIPGVPLIYYGDEVGLPGAGDPDNRRLMRFGGDLSGHEQGTLGFMQALGAARAAQPALRRGSWSAPLWQDGDVVAYARQVDGETVVVVLNNGDTPREVGLAVAGIGLQDGTALTDVVGAAGAPSVDGSVLTVAVGARSAAVLATHP